MKTKNSFLAAIAVVLGLASTFALSASANSAATTYYIDAQMVQNGQWSCQPVSIPTAVCSGTGAVCKLLITNTSAVPAVDAHALQNQCDVSITDSSTGSNGGPYTLTAGTPFAVRN
jgi:hypothetical protein